MPFLNQQVLTLIRVPGYQIREVQLLMIFYTNPVLLAPPHACQLAARIGVPTQHGNLPELAGAK